MKEIPERTEKPEKNRNLAFYKERATLLLNNIKPGKDSFNNFKDIAKEKSLLPKNEFHITLMGNKIGKVIREKLKVLSEEGKKELLSEIEKLYQSFNWQYSPVEDYYYISKKYPQTEEENEEERKSIIQVIDLPDIVPFYKKLNNLLETNFEVPFSHITLYTTSNKEDTKLIGIGIYSEKEFQDLNPEKIEPNKN